MVVFLDIRLPSPHRNMLLSWAFCLRIWMEGTGVQGDAWRDGWWRIPGFYQHDPTCRHTPHGSVCGIGPTPADWANLLSQRSCTSYFPQLKIHVCRTLLRSDEIWVWPTLSRSFLGAEQHAIIRIVNFLEFEVEITKTLKSTRYR